MLKFVQTLLIAIYYDTNPHDNDYGQPVYDNSVAVTIYFASPGNGSQILGHYGLWSSLY